MVKIWWPENIRTCYIKNKSKIWMNINEYGCGCENECEYEWISMWIWI